MEYDDRYHPAEQNDYDLKMNDRVLEELKKLDRGYNKIYRDVIRADKPKKRVAIDIYTSSFGSKIRDAETGVYYPYMVGSSDEDLFFSVSVSTGECKSLNGSNVLFYLSPEHYAKHHKITLSDETAKVWDETVQRWNDKRNKHLSSKKNKD